MLRTAASIAVLVVSVLLNIFLLSDLLLRSATVRDTATPIIKQENGPVKVRPSQDAPNAAAGQADQVVINQEQPVDIRASNPSPQTIKTIPVIPSGSPNPAAADGPQPSTTAWAPLVPPPGYAEPVAPSPPTSAQKPAPLTVRTASAPPPPGAITSANEQVLPGFFPWPPPVPSAAFTLDQHFLAKRNLHTLGDTATFVENTFNNAGYYEFRYYAAGSDGIAIVTPVHNIDDTGRTSNFMLPRIAAVCERLSMADNHFENCQSEPTSAQKTAFPSAFTLDGVRSWIKTIFGDETVRLRLFVVTVTPGAVIPNANLTPTNTDVDKWMTLGALELPTRYATKSLDDRYRVSILEYEFTNDKKNGSQFVKRSRLSIDRHVAGAGLWDLFPAKQ